MRKIKKLVVGLCLLAAVVSVVPNRTVYAASDLVNGRGEGQGVVTGNGDLEVDINLQEDQGSTESPNGNTGSSSQIVKPSTNDVGNGLGDRVSQNAKTGDWFSEKNIIVLLAAAGMFIVIVGMKKRKDYDN